MARELTGSAELFERARSVVPGGIYGHMAPGFLVPEEYPSFIARGEGASIWDVDGNRYIDYMCSYGPVVLGHRHPVVEAAVDTAGSDPALRRGRHRARSVDRHAIKGS